MITQCTVWNVKSDDNEINLYFFVLQTMLQVVPKTEVEMLTMTYQMMEQHYFIKEIVGTLLKVVRLFIFFCRIFVCMNVMLTK